VAILESARNEVFGSYNPELPAEATERPMSDAFVAI